MNDAQARRAAACCVVQGHPVIAGAAAPPETPEEEAAGDAGFGGREGPQPHPEASSMTLRHMRGMREARLIAEFVMRSHA